MMQCADVGDADGLVAQFQMDTIAADICFERFPADPRQARNVFAEFLLRGLYCCESLFDLLCDDER